MGNIQLKGNLKLGADSGSAVEYGSSISEFIIRRQREEITIPATLGTGRKSSEAGALTEHLMIGFHSSTAAASVWAELYDALDTDASTLYFEGTLNPGAVGADNPEFSGTIIVLGLDTGATVSKLREQKQTYPVTVAGVTKVIV